MWSLNGEVALDAIEGELEGSDLELDLSNWLAPRLSFLVWGADIHGRISLYGDDPTPDDSQSHASPSIAELPSP